MALALVESIYIPLGTKMPRFSLKDPVGQGYESDKLYGKRGLLVAFSCNHCPYALAVWPRFIKLARFAKEMMINTVAINPNIHPDYPEDSPDRMKEKMKEWALDFPYLIDDAQLVAKNFKAQCTPDIFLFNRAQELIYHGRIDNSWKDETKVTRQELKEAISNYVEGLPITADQKPSMGCSIKWKE